MRATTTEGLAARAMVLAQHSGIKPGYDSYAFAFDPEDGTITGRRLDMLLRDAAAMAGTPVPHPDAELLALRPEYERLRREYDAFNECDDLTDDEVTGAGKEYDDFCMRVVAMPPARTAEGWAFKAQTVLAQHVYVDDGEDDAHGTIRILLQEIVNADSAQVTP